jgi:hypothetical protein
VVVVGSILAAFALVAGVGSWYFEKRQAWMDSAWARADAARRSVALFHLSAVLFMLSGVVILWSAR